jgi:hypothetical protein
MLWRYLCRLKSTVTACVMVYVPPSVINIYSVSLTASVTRHHWIMGRFGPARSIRATHCSGFSLSPSASIPKAESTPQKVSFQKVHTGNLVTSSFYAPSFQPLKASLNNPITDTRPIGQRLSCSIPDLLVTNGSLREPGKFWLGK